MESRMRRGLHSIYESIIIEQKLYKKYPQATKQANIALQCLFEQIYFNSLGIFITYSYPNSTSIILADDTIQ